MKKILLSLLLLVSVAFGTPTTTTIHADYDTYADSTNRTFNYGNTVEYYIGNRTGTAETVMWVHFDYAGAGIPSNAIVSAAPCTLFCASMNSSTTWYVRARLLDSAWVEGTGNGAFQNGSASWIHQGYGTAIDGSTIAQADRFWGPDSATTMTIPPKGGAWSTAVIDSEVVTATPDSFLVFDLASGVQSQLASGKNFGFHFFGTSTTNSQRVVVVSSEGATVTDHPRIDVTWDYPDTTSISLDAIDAAYTVGDIINLTYSRPNVQMVKVELNTNDSQGLWTTLKSGLDADGYNWTVSKRTRKSTRARIAVTDESDPTNTDTTAWFFIDQPGFTRVLVTPPGTPPIYGTALIGFPITMPTYSLSIWDSTLNTRLPWTAESLFSDRMVVRVRKTFGELNEPLYIQVAAASYYHDPEKVYLLYDNFNRDDKVYTELTDFDDYNASIRDTVPPIIFSTADWDSSVREGSQIIYDWQESDPWKRYKWFYTANSFHDDPNRYANNFMGYLTAPYPWGPWTRQGVMIDAVGDSINCEDAIFKWIPQYNKWIFAAENHNSPNSASVYSVCIYYADSLDGTFTFYKDVVPAITGGYPDGFLNGEPASPAFDETYELTGEPGDTLHMLIECFKGQLTDPTLHALWGDAQSLMALLVSYDDSTTGDSIGFDWHFTDSTGAINDAEPMPCVAWKPDEVVGQIDSFKTIPDWMVTDPDGDNWAFNHGGSVPSITYKSSAGWGDLVIQPIDSSQFADPPFKDPVSGKWIAHLLNSRADTVWNMRYIHYDGDLFDQTKQRWTVRNWSAKGGVISHQNFRGSLSGTKDGQLVIMPHTDWTGAMAFFSKEAFSGSVKADIWMRGTTVTGENLMFLSWGSDTLQDPNGLQAIKYYAFNSRGYTTKLQNAQVRTWRTVTGSSAVSTGGTDGTLPVDSMIKMSHYEYVYSWETGDDSIWVKRDGVYLNRTDDEVNHAMDKHFGIIVADRENINGWGSIVYVDSIRIGEYYRNEVVNEAVDTVLVTATTGSGKSSNGFLNSLQNRIAPKSKINYGWDGDRKSQGVKIIDIPNVVQTVVAPAGFEWFADSLTDALGYAVNFSLTMPNYSNGSEIYKVSINSFDAAPTGNNSQTSHIVSETSNLTRLYTITSPERVGATFGCFDFLDSIRTDAYLTTWEAWNTPYTTTRALIFDTRFTDDPGSHLDTVKARVRRGVYTGRVTDIVFASGQQNSFYYGTSGDMSVAKVDIDSILTWCDDWGVDVIMPWRNTSKYGGPGTYYGAPDDRTLGDYTSFISLGYLNDGPDCDTLLGVGGTILDADVGGGRLWLDEADAVYNQAPISVFGNDLAVLRFEYREDAASIANPAKFNVTWHFDAEEYNDSVYLNQDPETSVFRIARDYSTNTSSWTTDSLYVEDFVDNKCTAFFDVTDGVVEIRNVTLRSTTGDSTYQFFLPWEFEPEGIQSKETRYVGHSKTAYDGASTIRYEVPIARTSAENFLDTLMLNFGTHTCIKGFWLLGDEVQSSFWAPTTQAVYTNAGSAYADYIGDLAQIASENYPTKKVWIFSDMFDGWHNGVQFSRANCPINGGFMFADDSLYSRRSNLVMVPWGVDSQTDIDSQLVQKADWTWVAGVECYDPADGNPVWTSSDYWLTYAPDSVKAKGVAFLGYPFDWSEAVFDTIKTKWYKE